MKINVLGSVLAVTILILAAISFIWLPSMGGFGAVKTFGAWEGNAITNEPGSPFYSNMQMAQRMFDAFGGQIPNDPATQKFFQTRIVDTAMSVSLVDLAMQTEVEKVGYAPTDKLINVNLIKQFTDPNTGLYSSEAYDKTPEANKLKMRAETVLSLKRSRYIQDLFGFNGKYGLKTSTKEADFVAKMNSEKRNVQYVSFKPTVFPSEKIKAYGKENSDKFVKYDFSVISFQDKKTASTVSTEIASGNVSFEDALKSQDSNVVNAYVDEEGKLINSYQKDLGFIFPNAEDLKKIIDLKKGEVSTPVEMNSLYVILKCNNEPVQPDLTNTDLLDQISYYMRQYEKGIIEDYLVQHAKEFTKVANEKGMDEASLEFLVKPETTGDFSINYGNSKFLQPLPSTDSITAGIVDNEDFFKTIFSIKPGEFSKPFLINENAVVATVLEITPAEKEIANSTVENYKRENQNWTDYYILSILTGQYPMPLAQSTVVRYITEHPKAKNDIHKFTE